MAKTKKNVQKKRRQLRKKTRDGRGKSAIISQATHARRAERDRYRPTFYNVMLGDDNSVFSHLFEKNPKLVNVQYDLIDAIKKYRNLPERSDYPTRVLNAWQYELRTNPETGEMYFFVPRSTIQTNNFQTGYITFTFVESPFKPK